MPKNNKNKIFTNPITELLDNNEIFIVSSGTLLMDFIEYCKNIGHDISKLSGIPGTIGGAIYNNAGAYGLEISEILIGATIIKNGEMKYISNKDFVFEYRNTILKKKKLNDVIISAFFKITTKKNKNLIEKNKKKIVAIRKNKLPYSEKNIGSVFKNICLGDIKIPTGILLEKIGIKNLKYKNLKIDDKNSNIIINKGESTSADLNYFINMIKNKCIEEYGIELETEIEII